MFAILHFLPGSPARAILGMRATPAAIQAFNVANGYNRALPVQYLLYIDRLMHGNLGFSYHFDQSVGSLLSLDLPKSALLVGSSYVISLLIAIPMGIVQAMRREKPLDHALTAFSFVGYAMPTFWLGILLVVLFSSDAAHVPARRGPRGRRWRRRFADPGGLVLPVATLTIVTVAQFSRFMRASADGEPAAGLHPHRAGQGPATGRSCHQAPAAQQHAADHHAGRAEPAGRAVRGAIIVEALFNYPGMGWLFWTADRRA